MQMMSEVSLLLSSKWIQAGRTRNLYYFLQLPECFVLEGLLCCCWIKISVSAWMAVPRLLKMNHFMPFLMVQVKRPLWKPWIVMGTHPPQGLVLKNLFSAADRCVLGLWCQMASMKLVLERRMLSYTNTGRSLLLEISSFCALCQCWTWILIDLKAAWQWTGVTLLVQTLCHLLAHLSLLECTRLLLFSLWLLDGRFLFVFQMFLI